jgi:hypothetical protein
MLGRHFMKHQGGTLRKALSIIVLASIMATGCDRGSRPNPKREPIIPADAVVQICIDPVTAVRFEDEACDNPAEGFAWRYISFDGTYELPAVAERMNPLRGTSEMPVDKTIRTIPAKGATFGEPPSPQPSRVASKAP